MVAQLRERQRDHEFIARLHRRITEDKDILDRLAALPAVPQDGET